MASLKTVLSFLGLSLPRGWQLQSRDQLLLVSKHFPQFEAATGWAGTAQVQLILTAAGSHIRLTRAPLTVSSQLSVVNHLAVNHC